MPAHATGGPDGCSNCRRQEEDAVLATSQVPITNALLRDIEDEGRTLGTLQEVVYLRENLHWRVTKAMGVEVRLSSMPPESLKVSLAVGKGMHFKDEKKLSSYGEYRVMYPVMGGEARGAREE